MHFFNKSSIVKAVLVLVSLIERDESGKKEEWWKGAVQRVLPCTIQTEPNVIREVIFPKTEHKIIRQ